MEYFVNRQLLILIKPKNLHEEWPGYNNFETFQPIQAVIKFSVIQPALTGEQLFIEPSITQNICEQSLDRKPRVFGILFKCLIDIVDRRSDEALNAQVITDKTANVISGTLLDLCPVIIVVILLIVRSHSHQDIVTDFITFLQSEAGGIQTFKNELRIVAGIEGDAYNLQFTDSIVKLVNRDLFFQNLVIEKLIVDSQI